MQASIAFLCSAVFQNPRIPSTQAALLKVRHRARIPISSLPGKADLLQSRKVSAACKKRMTAFSDDANFPACLLGTAAEMPPARLSDAGGSDSDESDGEDGIDAASSGGKAAADSGSTASRVPNSALPAKFVALTDAGCGNWCVAQLQFWGFLVAAGVLDEAEWWRLLVGHTHRKADAVIAAFARAHKQQKNANFAPVSDDYSAHEQLHGSPQHFLRSMSHVFNSNDAWSTTPERLVAEVERVTQLRHT